MVDVDMGAANHGERCGEGASELRHARFHHGAGMGDRSAVGEFNGQPWHTTDPSELTTQPNIDQHVRSLHGKPSIPALDTRYASVERRQARSPEHDVSSFVRRRQDPHLGERQPVTLPVFSVLSHFISAPSSSFMYEPKVTAHRNDPYPPMYNATGASFLNLVPSSALPL